MFFSTCLKKYLGWAGSLTALFFAGCANFGNVMTQPQAEVQAVNIIQTTSAETRMLAVVVFKNPNPLDMTLKKIEYRLRLDQETVAADSFESPPLVKNQRNQSLEIPLVLQSASLAKLKLDDRYKYRFTGYALADNDWAPSPITFSSEGTLILPAVPKVQWAGFQPASGKHGSRFILELTNPNPFAVQISKTSGQLELEAQAFAWQARDLKLKVAPHQTLKIHVPYAKTGEQNPESEAPSEQKNGAPGSFWIQGELECSSPHGIITVVIHEKSSGGKEN